MKQMLRHAVPSITAILLCALPAAAQETRRPATPEPQPAFTVGTELWFVTIRGDLESDVSGMTDTKFTLVGAAEIEDEVIPRIYFAYSPEPALSFRLDLRRLDASGSSTLNHELVFDGVTFPQGSHVSSELTATWIGLECRGHVGAGTVEGFHSDWGVALRWLDARFEMSGPSGQGSQDYLIETLETSYQFEYVFKPGIGVGIDFGSRWGFMDSFIGFEIGGKVTYETRRVVLEAGLRWWNIAGALKGDPDLDLTLNGPYFSAAFRF